MNIMGKNKTNQTVIPVSEEFKEHPEELDWYTSLGEIQTKTSGSTEQASVVVNIYLGYKKEWK